MTPPTLAEARARREQAGAQFVYDTLAGCDTDLDRIFRDARIARAKAGFQGVRADEAFLAVVDAGISGLLGYEPAVS